MATHFEEIKNFDEEQMAVFLHNIEESALVKKSPRSIEEWKAFLSKGEEAK